MKVFLCLQHRWICSCFWDVRTVWTDLVLLKDGWALTSLARWRGYRAEERGKLPHRGRWRPPSTGGSSWLLRWDEREWVLHPEHDGHTSLKLHRATAHIHSRRYADVLWTSKLKLKKTMNSSFQLSPQILQELTGSSNHNPRFTTILTPDDDYIRGIDRFIYGPSISSQTGPPRLLD